MKQKDRMGKFLRGMKLFLVLFIVVQTIRLLTDALIFYFGLHTTELIIWTTLGVNVFVYIAFQILLPILFIFLINHIEKKRSEEHDRNNTE